MVPMPTHGLFHHRTLLLQTTFNRKTNYQTFKKLHSDSELYLAGSN